MYDIVSVGECLIDFTPVKTMKKRYPVFEQNPGGAPANMVAAAAAQGAETAFIGQVGNDQFGKFLSQELSGSNIDVSGMVLSNRHNTTLVFVHLEEDGQREFDFIRDADTKLKQQDVHWELIEQANLIHISSLAFSAPTIAHTTHQIIQFAKERNKYISYDANWRPMLWKDVNEGKKSLKTGVFFADIIKVSEEELVMITGIEDEAESVLYLFAQGVQMVLVTKGPQGTIAYTTNACKESDAVTINTPVVDTTGAGDICFGVFMYSFLESGKKIQTLTKEDLSVFQKRANTAAGISVTRYGGISSVPTKEEVLSAL